MSKLNNKLLKLHKNINIKKLRKIYDLETDLKYWDVFAMDTETIAYILSEDGYEQYGIETSRIMNIPNKIGNKYGK